MKTLRDRGHEVVAVSPPGEYGPRIRAQDIRWIELPMRRTSLNPLTELALVRKLAALYGRERPDIVHHFTIKCVVYGSLAARLARVPVRINAVAGLGTVFTDDSRSNRWLKVLVKQLLRAALSGRRSRLILQNPDDVRLFEQHGLIDRDRIHLIRGSGVDGHLFKKTSKPGAGTACRILFAARLLWAKGIGDYVHMAQALSGYRDAEFLIAGTPDPGNPDSVTEGDLDVWRDSDWLQVLGHVDDMKSLLETADIVVLPSVYGEGVPRILIEAAASGLPLLAYDVPGSREIVIDGENGHAVARGDRVALEAALRTLIENPDLRARMGTRSRAIFEQNFDQETVFRKTLGVYELAAAAS